MLPLPRTSTPSAVSGTQRFAERELRRRRIVGTNASGTTGMSASG